MIYLSILAALLLFLVLAATAARSLHAQSDLDIPGIGGPDALAPDDANQAFHFEILERIFNREDHRYLAEMGAPAVERFLLLERKRVAIAWIRRKVAEARYIMREHARRARTAKDLQVSGEIRLASQYLELLVLSEMLAVGVFLFGPAGLQGLALRTNGVLLGMRRLGETAALDPGGAMTR